MLPKSRVCKPTRSSDWLSPWTNFAVLMDVCVTGASSASGICAAGEESEISGSLFAGADFECGAKLATGVAASWFLFVPALVAGCGPLTGCTSFWCSSLLLFDASTWVSIFARWVFAFDVVSGRVLLSPVFAVGITIGEELETLDRVTTSFFVSAVVTGAIGSTNSDGAISLGAGVSD